LASFYPHTHQKLETLNPAAILMLSSTSPRKQIY